MHKAGKLEFSLYSFFEKARENKYLWAPPVLIASPSHPELRGAPAQSQGDGPLAAAAPRHKGLLQAGWPQQASSQTAGIPSWSGLRIGSSSGRACGAARHAAVRAETQAVSGAASPCLPPLLVPCDPACLPSPVLRLTPDPPAPPCSVSSSEAAETVPAEPPADAAEAPPAAPAGATAQLASAGTGEGAAAAAGPKQQPRQLTQMYLDVGQRDFHSYRCPTCGMLYARGTDAGAGPSAWSWLKNCVGPNQCCLVAWLAHWPVCAAATCD